MTSSKAQAISHKLANFAKQQGIQYQFALTTFLIQQLFIKLARNTNVGRHLIFKGGFVMLRVYKSPRYTIDLDASLKGINLDQIKSEVIEAIETSSEDGTWFRFERNIDLETQGEYGGLRFVFRAGVGEILKNISKAQIINLDLGFGDAVKEVAHNLPLLLSDDECRCNIYPAEVMVAEKLHSLIARSIGNSRSKDVFDIAHLGDVVSIGELRTALKSTFAARGEELPVDLVRHFQFMDTSVLQRGWKAAISSIIDAPSFETSMDAVIQLIKKI